MSMVGGVNGGSVGSTGGLEGGGQGCRVGVCGRPLGRADLGRGYNLYETSSPLPNLEPVSSLRAV